MFPHTLAALRAYDEGRAAREQAWERASKSEVEVEEAERCDKAAELKVQEALYADTQPINCLDNCKLVHPDDPWLRWTVDKYVKELLKQGANSICEEEDARVLEALNQRMESR